LGGEHHIFLYHQCGLFGILLDYGEQALETDRLIGVVHEHGIQAVITVLELNNMMRASSDSVIILSRQVLQRLHKLSLHVTSLSRLDSRVYQALSATACMEEELSRGQTSVKTILYETLRGWIFRVGLEMGQTSIEKAVGHSLAINCLLAY
jgi:hypothetical protein